MIEWATVAWKAKPLAVNQARRWWNRNLSKNLSRRVIEELERDTRIPEGARDELVRQWLTVRGDSRLVQVIEYLLVDPEPSIEPLVEARLRELLGGLPLVLGVEPTARRLSVAVLTQLGAAQKTPGAADRADNRRTHNKLDSLAEPSG